MGYVTVPATLEIATHAALSQNVHGAGAYDILDSNDLTGYSMIAAGTYTGNDTVNRAIPHGLGVVPKLVIMDKTAEAAAFCRNLSGTLILGTDSGTDNALAVTTWDATNFYVGNASNYSASGNHNPKAYAWVAVA